MTFNSRSRQCRRRHHQALVARFRHILHFNGRRICRYSRIDVTAAVDLLGRTDELGEDAPLPDQLG